MTTLMEKNVQAALFMPLTEFWLGRTAMVRSVVWVLLSALLFSLMGALAKSLGSRIDSMQVAFFRALFGFIFILPVVLRTGFRGLRTRQPLLHLWRGLVGGAAIMCSFYSMIHLPLADAAALSFTRVVFLAPLAVFFLNEKFDMRRLLTVSAGLAGVILMTSPEGGFQFATLVALLSAALVAGVVIFVKRLSAEDSPATLIFYSSAIAALMTAGPCLWVWTPPTIFEWLMLSVMALLGVLAQSCFIRGYAVGEATVLAPLEYTRLLFAALAGYLMFGDVPGVWAVAGAAMIIGASVAAARTDAKPASILPHPVNG
ncbi:MAG: DMT family transporter [Alphaproteobacteria bacterium]|nr:DMT family transporter [Alphaproteobacteria bacterium]